MFLCCVFASRSAWWTGCLSAVSFLGSCMSAVLLEDGACHAHSSAHARANPPGCQNQWNYCRRFCKSFTNRTQATSSQWSFVNMNAFLGPLLLSALFGGHHMQTPCRILAVGFPQVTLLLQRKHAWGCAPTKPNSIACGYAHCWVCKTGKHM